MNVKLILKTDLQYVIISVP